MAEIKLTRRHRYIRGVMPDPVAIKRAEEDRLKREAVEAEAEKKRLAAENTETVLNCLRASAAYNNRTYRPIGHAARLLQTVMGTPNGPS